MRTTSGTSATRVSPVRRCRERVTRRGRRRSAPRARRGGASSATHRHPARRPAARPVASSTRSTVAGDVEKADPPLQEGLHRDLVGRVQDGGGAAARAQGVARQPQRREPHRVGLDELEPRQRGQIEPRRAGRHPLRPGQRVRDRDAHVRASRAAPARCRRGNRPCRGSTDCGCTSTPIRVSGRPNSRAASISSRPLFIIVARVDADLGAHRPDRVAQRRLRRRARHLLAAGGAERAAGGGQHDPLHRAPIAVGQRLEDRVVLGIDRQQGGAGLAHRAQHHLAGADQRLLVGQRHARRRGGSRPASRQAGRAGDRGHRPVGRQARRPRPPPPARRAVSMPVPASASTQRRRTRRDRRSRRVRRRARAPARRAAPTLRPPTSARTRKRSGSAASSSTVCVPTLPVLPSTVDADRRHRHRCYSAPEHEGQQRRRRGRRQHAVEPVEQAAMAGDQPAGILDPETALDGALQQVARLRHDPEHAATSAIRSRLRRGRHSATQHRDHGRSRRSQPAARAGPGLARRDARSELRPAAPAGPTR